MHETSYRAMKHLLEILVPHANGTPISILDVGSQVAEPGQQSYREIIAGLGNATYTGLDVTPGDNVDVVATNGYEFPVESESFDFVISGQAFEHIEFPWLTIKEMARALKAGGMAVVIAPSSGYEHRYPLDCWRYYPDGMRALGKWAELDCIASITNWHETKLFLWGDTVGVFHKPRADNAHDDIPDLRIDELERMYRSLRPGLVEALRWFYMRWRQ